MFIGEASKTTGLTIKAIRLYEEKGLIRAPQRQGRYRVYTDADIEILSLIYEAKKLGISLAKLKDVIVYRNGKTDWDRINRFMKEVKRELEAELVSISNNIRKVEKCIQSIDSCPNTVDSPLRGRQ